MKIHRIMKRLVSKSYLEFLFLSYKASRLYQTSFMRIFFWYLHLWHRRGFSSKEAFQLGLLNPEISENELDRYCSKKSMIKLQRSINPLSWFPFTEDKSIFYKYCMAADIPIPKLYAVFFQDTPGWVCTGKTLRHRDAWKFFFENELPAEFVIKPAKGVYGEGVHVLKRSGERFSDASGKSYTADEVYGIMQSDRFYDSFVIQERLHNHSELFRLSNTHALQTIRLISFVDSRGIVHILYAALKIVTGENIIDNFEWGMTGNLMAKISDKGWLQQVITMNPDCPGIRIVHEHPTTGILFDSFQIPLWDEVFSLVQELAVKFLPIRQIGWDIAITPKGVKVIEGNKWADPPNQHRGLDRIVATLSTER